MAIKTKLKIFLAVFIILLFLHYTKIIYPLENQFFNLIIPSQHLLYQKSNKINSFFYYLLNSQKLLKENEELKNKVNQLTLEQVELKTLKSENDVLKKSLNYFKTTNYQYLSAQIIGRSSFNPQLLILDQGRLAGVKENLAGIYSQGVMVGKIQKVEDQISYLLLLTDNQSQIAAKTINEKQTIGLVKGELGINAKLIMIPQEEEINNGDLIVTSGLEENIPSGFLIGEVSEIKNQPSALFKEAILNPFFDLRQLNFISIILSKT